MIFDYKNKNIQVKIVYYGPAMSGKTTSLKKLFSYFGKNNKLESIENTVGRTLFFDFGVLRFKGSDWGLKFLLYSATGQDFYASTRPATLNGVDGIIFIADSHKKRLEHNIQSWNELKMLFKERLYQLPLVISLNKSDLDHSEKIRGEELLEKIDLKGNPSLVLNQSSAINGKGIIEAFKSLIHQLFPQLEMNIGLTP